MSDDFLGALDMFGYFKYSIFPLNGSPLRVYLGDIVTR